MSDELLELARLGINAETFKRSDLGKFLQRKAETERKDALNDLVNAAPDDIKANTDARNRIHVVGMFLTWINDAIDIGRSAHEQLDSE